MVVWITECVCEGLDSLMSYECVELYWSEVTVVLEGGGDRGYNNSHTLKHSAQMCNLLMCESLFPVCLMYCIVCDFPT